MNKHKLSAVNIAFLYVGTLMGAGFASGREIWQFFGVFGNKSYLAILLITILFILYGILTVNISRELDTTDIGKIIMPFENKYLENFFGYVTAAILFIVYIVMAAAGGALFQEQFGVHRIFGGMILMILVVGTTLGGFERISKNFKYIIPVLLVVVFMVCISILVRKLSVSAMPIEATISPMTPNWFFSAVVYISYNMLAGIPILANSTQRAGTYKTALYGAAMGGVILGMAAWIMNDAMLTDPGLSSSSVLPVLVLSGKLSGWVRWIYAALLLFAVYASATSNFYGYTTKIKDGNHKKYFIMLSALVGFFLSLIGFADIIAFVLPLEGYCGLIFLTAMTIHFVSIYIKKNQMLKSSEMKSQENEKTDYEEPNMNTNFEKTKDITKADSDSENRFDFPEGIKRVTAGSGGEAVLVIGSEKTALIDCGMAYCGDQLVENTKSILGNRNLDYVILSHTHYDHIGGLPYLRKYWPDLIVFGAPYGKKILEKDSALNQIENLSRVAAEKYMGCMNPAVLMEGLKIDQTICEKDVIHLGNRQLQVIETPGHTACSISVVLKPDLILFASETTGVYGGKGEMMAGVLKSYRETMESIQKCRNIKAERIISPHYGLVPKEKTETYWDLAEEIIWANINYIIEKKKEGALFEEILEEYTKEFWIDERTNEQPKEAFLLNAQYMIQNVLKELNVE